MRHTAGHVVVATGADPVTPPIPGLGKLEDVWGTRQATSMKVVPRHLLVIGGGPAGTELAQAVRRLGGEVTLVESAPHVLSREAAPLGEALGEALRRDGIELILGVQVTGARKEGADYVLAIGDGRELRGDHLLVARRVDVLELATLVWKPSTPRRTVMGSKSIRTCAPASDCGRSATSPASGL